MAVGDDATAAGFALVPDTGVAGEVKLGAQEINRTRDYIAQVKALIQAVWPVSAGGTGGNTSLTAQAGLGIFSGTAAPSDTVGGAVDGNIYFQIVS
jgi:hypothetical protein